MSEAENQYDQFYIPPHPVSDTIKDAINDWIYHKSNDMTCPNDFVEAWDNMGTWEKDLLVDQIIGKLVERGVIPSLRPVPIWLDQGQPEPPPDAWDML